MLRLIQMENEGNNQKLLNFKINSEHFNPVRVEEI